MENLLIIDEIRLADIINKKNYIYILSGVLLDERAGDLCGDYQRSPDFILNESHFGLSPKPSNSIAPADFFGLKVMYSDLKIMPYDLGTDQKKRFELVVFKCGKLMGTITPIQQAARNISKSFSELSAAMTKSMQKATENIRKAISSMSTDDWRNLMDKINKK